MGGTSWKELLREYWAGVVKIPQIFQRIGFRKRTLEDELNEALLRGNLRRVFNGFDLLMLGVGITIGGGVWRLTGSAAHELAGPAIILSYMIAGLACTFAAACYGELAVEYPVAGGAFTYIMVSFGEFPAWMTVCNQITEYLFGMAVVARSFSAYLADLCGKPTTFFRLGGPADNPSAWSVDLMAAGIVLAVSALLSFSGRRGSFFISGATVIKLGVISFIIVVGLTRANPDNLHPFLLDNGVNGVFAAASVFMYAMTGFDSISNAAEEAKNVSSLPWAMMGTTLLSMTTYMLLALMLTMMQPSSQISSTDGITRAFIAVGLDYMQYLVATAAVLGCITGLLVGLFAASRIVMVVARDWMLPPVLARVSPRTQTPLIAQILLGCVIGTLTLLIPADFLEDLVSFGQLLSMWSVVNAQMYRRYFPEIKLRFTRFGAVETANAKPETLALGSRLNLSVGVRRRLVALHMVLMTLTATALATWYTVTEKHSSRTIEVIGCSVFAALFLIVTVSMKLLCPMQYQPSRFHIPSVLMPWLPAIAIGLIMFGMTSIQPTGYYKIGVYNLCVLVFYFLFSLPMSYIKHYKLDFVHTEQLNVVDLVYVDGQWKPCASTAARLGSYLTPDMSEASYPTRQWSRHLSTPVRFSGVLAAQGGQNASWPLPHSTSMSNSLSLPTTSQRDVGTALRSSVDLSPRSGDAGEAAGGGMGPAPGTGFETIQEEASVSQAPSTRDERSGA